MGIDVNPPPAYKIPNSLLKDPELRDFFLYWQDVLFKLWLRSGGGNDSTSDMVAQVFNNSQVLAGNDSDIGKIQAVNKDQSNLIEDLFDLVQTDRQNIADLISDNGKLRALVVKLQRDASNTGQVLAGLE